MNCTSHDIWIASYDPLDKESMSKQRCQTIKLVATRSLALGGVLCHEVVMVGVEWRQHAPCRTGRSMNF